MSRQITVEGMSCEHCEERVEEQLAAISGVTAADADHDTDTVLIEGSASTESITAAIEAAGYERAE